MSRDGDREYLETVSPRQVGLKSKKNNFNFTFLVGGRGPKFESRQGWRTNLKSGLQNVEIMTMAGW